VLRYFLHRDADLQSAAWRVFLRAVEPCLRAHSPGSGPAFQKKSKSGIKTPTEDLELIRRRLKAAEADYKVQLGKGKGP